MAQYIIYYLDRSFIISNCQLSDNISESNFMKPEDIIKIANDFESDFKKKHFYFFTKDIDTAFTAFQKNFEVIEAAGGLVRNSNKDVLAIFRLGKWDLPKGKIENNESPEEAALREISEECGINGHVLIKKICETYHTYKMNGKKILKKTYWFDFNIDGVPELCPQTIENIEEACWLKLADFKIKLENSYPSIRQVVSEYENI
ncbi:MAG: NUDIX domain-containing protein [Bacteroidia bacterium]|nr:NUDIX domain-containing protein [Bacteroidia bacterium]